MLIDWNSKFNLTAITEINEIIEYHFTDSLMVAHCPQFKNGNCIGDVGTGAGFPAIPVKIKYPDRAMVLIEVNQKKITFLQQVIAELGLDKIEICDLDWRNFLRKTDYKIDMFVARAALRPEELLYAFKPKSPYKYACIVYWAAKSWKPTPIQESYIAQIIPYAVGDKERKLVILTN